MNSAVHITHCAQEWCGKCAELFPDIYDICQCAELCSSAGHSLKFAVCVVYCLVLYRIVLCVVCCVHMHCGESRVAAAQVIP